MNGKNFFREDIMRPTICYSIFDIFKKGPGPSSSHTIGPMRAAGDFMERVTRSFPNMDLSSARLDVFLYGSLSSTGMGHGTHRAILGGLLGWKPATCDCDHLQRLFEEDGKIYSLALGGGEIPFTRENIHFAGTKAGLPYENTLVFRLSQNGKGLHEEEYYSVGGGFIKRKGEKEPVPASLPFAYANMTDFRELLRQTHLTPSEILLRNEETLSGKSREEIYDGLRDVIETMCRSVENGLRANGVLPGSIGLQRKARALITHAQGREYPAEQELASLNAFAIAASEENAAGKRIVTAPTSGSAGVLAGITYFMKQFYKASDEVLCEGLLAAALIAFISKHNASIAGAEVGCQGEVGVASAMAAAFLTYATGKAFNRVENAAEIALEHHLGLTCDPVEGYVQIPCIERNAVGAATALDAYILASSGDPLKQKVSFDEVVEAMLETGRDMSVKYRETAQGGLAVCYVSC